MDTLRDTHQSTHINWLLPQADASQIQDIATLVESSKKNNLGPIVLFAEGVSSNGRYRGTSLIRNNPLLGPYSRTMSRTLGRGGGFL